MSEKTNTHISWGPSLILLVVDLLAFAFSFFLAFYIRTILTPWFNGPIYWETVAVHSYIVIGLSIILFASSGLYPAFGMSGQSETWNVVKAIAIAFLITSVAVFALKQGQNLSRFFFLSAWALSSIVVPITRLYVQNLGSRFDFWRYRAAIVGKSDRVKALLHKLKQSPKLRITPVAYYLTDYPPPADFLNEVTGKTSIHPMDTLLQNNLRTDLAVFVGSGSYETDEKIITRLNVLFKHLIFLIDLPSLNSLSIRSFDGFMQPALDVEFHLLNPGVMLVKRIFDIIVGLIVFIISLPFLGIIALLIKLDSPGKVMYRQTRMGKNGDEFQIYKFRTMFVDAEKILSDLIRQDEDLAAEYLTYHKLKDDPRVTRMGKILRKTSLDELPQILNIMNGDMSLVGPRAYMPSEREDMGEDADIILRVRPGLTGWWQVMGRHEVSFKERLKLDRFYIINFSLWMDIYIIIKTAWVILSGKGA